MQPQCIDCSFSLQCVQASVLVKVHFRSVCIIASSPLQWVHIWRGQSCLKSRATQIRPSRKVLPSQGMYWSSQQFLSMLLRLTSSDGHGISFHKKGLGYQLSNNNVTRHHFVLLCIEVNKAIISQRRSKPIFPVQHFLFVRGLDYSTDYHERVVAAREYLERHLYIGHPILCNLSRLCQAASERVLVDLATIRSGWYH